MLTPGESGRGIERDLPERIRSAALACIGYWFYRWDWGESIAFDGLREASNRLHWPAGRALLDDELHRELSLWRAGITPSSYAPLRCILLERAHHDEAKIRAGILAVLRNLAASPRSTRGAFLLDGRGAFVDSLYTEPVLCVDAGVAYEDDKLVRLGIEFALGHLRELQDSDGLMRHFSDSAEGLSPVVHWGRGNGWAILGLADLLAAAPTGVDGLAEVQQRFRQLAATVCAHFVSGMGWRNIIDAPTSYAESSTTAMVVAALTLGISRGSLGHELAPFADEGWTAIAHRIDTNGHLTGVSYRPGLQAHAERYEHTPAIGIYPWGNGPFLRAACQRLKEKSR